MASTWAFFMANWYFGLLWDFANNGQSVSIQEIEARNAEFAAKKMLLLKKLRSEASTANILSSTVELLDAYTKNSLPKEARPGVSRATVRLLKKFRPWPPCKGPTARYLCV